MIMLLAVPSFAWADEITLFSEACHEMNVPLELALAIARTESGMNPYALNIAGVSHYLSKEKAIQAARQARAEGMSFDVGIMQINCQWLKNVSIEAAFDPANNIRLGVWILSREISAHGLTLKAIARYHSPNNERGIKYANTVLRNLNKSINLTANREFAGSALKVNLINLLNPASEDNYESKFIFRHKNRLGNPAIPFSATEP